MLSQVRGLGGLAARLCRRLSCSLHPAPDACEISKCSTACQRPFSMFPLELIFGKRSLATPVWMSFSENFRHQRVHHFGRALEEAFLELETLRCDRPEHSSAFQETVIGEPCNGAHWERAIGPKNEDKVEFLGDFADLRVHRLLLVEGCRPQPCP